MRGRCAYGHWYRGAVTEQAPPKSELSQSEQPAEPQRVGGLTVEEWIAVDPRRTERVTRWIAILIVDVFFRLKTYGAEHIPESGPFILCANHASYMDPFFQVRGQSRLIRYMAKAEVFETPGLRWFMRTGGSFPVRRGAGDTFAIDVARGVLASGQPLFVYPEGTRFRRTPELGPARSGAARLALETKTVVIPAATWGNKPRKVRIGARTRFGWPKVTTVFGEPMDFTHLEPTPENITQARDEIWAEVHRLYGIAGELSRRRWRPRRLCVPARN